MDMNKPDRWCYPQSDAMTGVEIDLMVKRISRMPESLADRLVIRDRNGDDRISCAECKQGKSSVCDDVLPKPWDVLQRCDRFQAGPFDADLDMPVVTKRWGSKKPEPVRQQAAPGIPHARDF